MKFPTSLQTPIINLNGNTADSLLDQLRAVLLVMQDLEKAMAQASDVAHGRNFQTLPDARERTDQAIQAWHERRLMVAQLHNEVLVLAVGIQNQKYMRDDKQPPLVLEDGVPEGWDKVEGGAVSPEDK